LNQAVFQTSVPGKSVVGAESSVISVEFYPPPPQAKIKVFLLRAANFCIRVIAIEESEMSVVPVSQLNLARARREMEKSYKTGDWQAVQDWDQLVALQLSQAFDDPARDHKMLVGELEKVLELYSQMVRSLPEVTADNWLRPELVY
jgi:hypothetical protein